AVRVMAERGVDIADRPTKSLARFAGTRFDRGSTLCYRLGATCQESPGAPVLSRWSVVDPADAESSDDATYPAFQDVADEIDSRVALLLADLRVRPLGRTHHG